MGSSCRVPPNKQKLCQSKRRSLLLRPASRSTGSLASGIRIDDLSVVGYSGGRSGWLLLHRISRSRGMHTAPSEPWGIQLTDDIRHPRTGFRLRTRSPTQCRARRRRVALGSEGKRDHAVCLVGTLSTIDRGASISRPGVTNNEAPADARQPRR